MEKIVISLLLFCVAFVCACMFLLRSLQLVGDGSARLTVYVGKIVLLAGVVELAGGYRYCVLKDGYFRVSPEDCQ